MSHDIPFETCISTLREYVFKRGIHYGLDHVTQALEALGNPHLKLPPAIHVAGTNGKGSTVHLIQQGLLALGYSVGAFTSPHLICYTERFQINQTAISTEVFSTLFHRVHSITKLIALTEFEILFLMSCLFFSESHLDYCIFEVGLGGRLDATNVIHPIVSIITSTKIRVDRQSVHRCPSKQSCSSLTRTQPLQRTRRQ